MSLEVFPEFGDFTLPKEIFLNLGKFFLFRGHFSKLGEVYFCVGYFLYGEKFSLSLKAIF